MNSGFLGPAIATVLTACGIETLDFRQIVHRLIDCNSTYRLRY